MKNEKLYELNPSQEVVKLQCKYSLFKRVVNITMSATSEEKLDFALMKEALNKVIERNDCLRLRFVKKDKKLMQYFLKSFVFDEVPYIEFKTQEQQLSFIQKETAKPIKYLKNEVLKPYFCKTFDGKDMVLVKACHFILDMYGFNVFFNELFGVYNALKNKTELPEPPTSFEEVIKKDLTTKYNEKKVKSDAEYYKNFFKENEEPAYAGFDGRISSVFSYNVKGGYVYYGNAMLDAVVLDAVPYASVRYAPYQKWFVAMDWLLKTERVRLDGSLSYDHAWGELFDTGYAGVAVLKPAALTGDVSFEYNWNRRVFAGVDCSFSTARKGGFGMPGLGSDQVPLSMLKVPGYADLGFFAEYATARGLAFWVRAGNLLNMTVQRNPLYAERGVNFTLGICLSL